MKLKVNLILCFVFILCALKAQTKGDKYGAPIPDWDRLTATEEKKDLDFGEQFFMMESTYDPENILFESENSDTLIFEGKKYNFITNPIQGSYNKAPYILYDNEELTEYQLYIKRYVLTYELKGDSLYIIDYNLAPDYQGNKTKEDVRKDIERMWGKQFKKGKLTVDWLTFFETTTVRFYFRDEAVNVSCLIFKGGRLNQIKERPDLNVRKIRIIPNYPYTNADYQPWIERMRRTAYCSSDLEKGLRNLGLPLPEIMPKEK